MRVGLVGWRGMVGSVLRDRMTEEGDWSGIEPVFFSTSSPGGTAPMASGARSALQDAFNLPALSQMQVIVTCRGSDYTNRIYPSLRAQGWRGVWIDAASALRLSPEATIVLDPLNRPAIDRALSEGCRTLVGGNCTVSLMLMGIGGLIQQGWVSWISMMTYQAASGAGAQAMETLAHQMADLTSVARPILADPDSSPLDLERAITARLRSPEHPLGALNHPLAASLLPHIDVAMPDGRSREEWKGQEETNRILKPQTPVNVDGICVRVGALRCHSSALTIGLSRDVPIGEVREVLSQTSPWTRLIPNTPEASLQQLTPAAVSGSLDVAVGRVRKMTTHPNHLSAFTVGDQLLWGAAEPIRRALKIVREHGTAQLGL